MENRFKIILKLERTRRNLEQKDVAKVLNVSKQTISNWENGHRVPDIFTICQLADFLGCSTDYLLGRNTDSDMLNIKNLTIKKQLLVRKLVKELS